MGDLNIHHRIWLRHSRENTSRGAKLKEICDGAGLRQLIREPTRGDYLLDLVLTDYADVKVTLGPKIADHSALLVTVPDAMESRELPPRRLWHYADANWEAMAVPT